MKKFNQSYLIYISNDLQNFQHFDVTRPFTPYMDRVSIFFTIFKIKVYNKNLYYNT